MLRSIILAFVFVAVLSVQTFAEPYLQVFDDSFNPRIHSSQYGTLQELIVVLQDVDFTVSAIDFHIDYPAPLIWLQDELPDPAYLNNEVVKIGSSPTGVAVAWHPCCMQDAKPGHPLIVLRVLVLWGVNDYDICLPLAVGGYTPLGKTLPSVIQYPDLTEHSVHPLTSLINYEFCVSPVDQTTWGKVKALYR